MGHVWIAVCLLLSTCAAHAQHLRSPWDSQTIRPTSATYRCPSPPAFADTVNPGTYYIDEHASIIDPKKQAAYQQATEAATHFSQVVALAADAWLEKGSISAAQCVYTLLNAAAAAHAWAGEMPDFSGVYTQNWLLSAVAISYLKVRNSHAGKQEQGEDIQRWFNRLARHVTNFFIAEASRLGNEKENNHMYWAGLALTAEGIADDDLLDYSWGIGAYEIGVNNIQPDGSLTAEMARGQMAFHYHLYALAPLVIIAELVEANGMDLYGDKNGMIHRLVSLCAAGLDDPILFEKRTGVKQVITRPYAGGDIGWAVPYVQRFPNPRLSAWIASAPWVRYTTWGGTPPDGVTGKHKIGTEPLP